MAVPNIFGSATSAIPLSQLDQNFATAITLGNTAVYLGNTTTSLGNVTLTNVTISSGNVTVTGANVSGTANISTLVTTNDATISGLTVGKGAGAVATNTAVGASALAANSSGGNNVAIGYQAGLANSTGGQSTLIGSQAGLAGTDLDYVTAVGYQALSSVTSGDFNTALGAQALKSNTTASNNTAVGYQAGYSNTTGAGNTFVGQVAGYTSNGGSTAYNTCVGAASGYSLTTGTNNTFVGALTPSGNGSGGVVTTGSKNTILGAYTGNQDSLDIRTGDNYAVISDGDGNRQITMKEGQTLALDSAVPNAGTGITFPATQSASSNANTLDDYEEGTWTPTLVCGTSGTITLNSGFAGTYTKIGRQVTVCVSAYADSVASPVGSLTMNGLPFTSSSGNSFASGVAVHGQSTLIPAGSFIDARVLDNQTSILIYAFTSGTITDAASYVQSTTLFTFTCSYFV